MRSGSHWQKHGLHRGLASLIACSCSISPTFLVRARACSPLLSLHVRHPTQLCAPSPAPSLPARLPACLQDPGKVFKGKKMPGRMGGERTTVQNCQVFRVDPLRNLVYVQGQVPGHKGNFVLVRDSAKKTLAQQPPLPVPTLLGGAAAAEVTVAPKADVDPFEYREG